MTLKHRAQSTVHTVLRAQNPVPCQFASLHAFPLFFRTARKLGNCICTDAFFLYSTSPSSCYAQ